MPPRIENPNAPASGDSGWVHYVEPYFGGGAVLFAMEPWGISEVVNDLDLELTNFWRVLQDESDFSTFIRIVQAIPASQLEFRWSQSPHDFVTGRVMQAVKFFIRNRQSRQALGRDFATLSRNRTRRGMNELPAAWLSAVDGLPEVHSRLKRVVILNEDALKVIRQQDGKRTLFYLDPPYLHSTRVTTGEYQHEMTVKDHISLLGLLSTINGRFLLSGYRSDLYDSAAKENSWRRVDFKIANHASGKATKERKTECVWMNY